MYRYRHKFKFPIDIENSGDTRQRVWGIADFALRKKVFQNLKKQTSTVEIRKNLSQGNTTFSIDDW